MFFIKNPLLKKKGVVEKDIHFIILHYSSLVKLQSPPDSTNSTELELF